MCRIISLVLLFLTSCQGQPVSPPVPHAYPLKAKIVLDGNSLTATAANNPSWIGFLKPMLNDPSITWVNSGVGGHKLTNMLADTATIDGLYDSSKTRNILIVWGGTNDIHVSPYDDSTTTYDRLVQYCAGRKIHGYKIYVLTCIGRWGSATYNTNRHGYNRAIRANYATFADVLVDVASLPEFDENTDGGDVAYYTDGVHLTPDGYRLIATEVYRAIKTGEAP